MSKSNILIVNPLGKSISGVDESLCNFLRTVENSDLNIQIVVPGHSYYSDIYEKMGYDVRMKLVDSLRKSYNPWVYAKYLISFLMAVPLFIRFYLKQKTDLVHINMHLTLAPALAAKICGIPVVYHYRTGTGISPRFFFRILIGIIDCLSDRIIVISEAAKSLFVETGGSEEKIEVIYDGVDLETFDSDVDPVDIQGIEDENIVLGTVTRITPEKNLETCIKALPVIQSSQKVKYLVVGDVISQKDEDYKRYLRELVKELDLEDRVIFTGTLRNIAGVLKAVDLFLFPVKTKGFVPRCLLEAGVMGVPGISYKQSGVEEINLSGAFNLVENLDPECWADEIKKQLNEMKDYPGKKEKMKTRYRKKFDTRNTTKRIVSVYEESLKCV